jgi:hypothetical protein
LPLKDTILITPSGRKVRFSIQEIAVCYEEVNRIVPNLHERAYQYIIHLGVGRNGFITLENRARSGGYYGKDINGKEGPMENKGVYVTKWDVERLVDILHSLGFNVRILI